VLDWFTSQVKHLSPENAASAAAHLFAPGLVIILTFVGTSERTGIDLMPPVSVTTLRSLISHDGRVVSQHGVAITVEPTSMEWTLPIASPRPELWTSLDSGEVEINRSRLVFVNGMLAIKAPYIGVSRPITVVIEGVAGEQMLFPGGHDTLAELTPPAKRSLALVYSVTMVCIFAFGMSISTAIPLVGKQQDVAG